MVGVRKALSPKRHVHDVVYAASMGLLSAFGATRGAGRVEDAGVVVWIN
jgi:hypothetical protein